MTPEQVQATIETVPDLPDEELTYIYKCSISRQLTAEKKLLKPLITAIERERKARNKLKPKPIIDEPVEDLEELINE